MHHIYHTEGFILGSQNFGEAGKYYSIFTKELGMIYASASGVRKLSSKLRFVLQDFSYIKIDLVRGRDFWRLTSASKTNMLEDISKQPDVFLTVSNIARLLKRLLSGEEKNKDLFDCLINGFSVLEKTKSMEEIRNIEMIIVLRVLHNLGYIGGGADLENLIVSPFEENMLLLAKNNRSKVLLEINKALNETHL